MGSIMNWIAGIVQHKQTQQRQRTEKLAKIHQLTAETLKETQLLRGRVQQIQQSVDPLAELMRTLRPKRRRAK